MLSELGYDCASATDGEEALDLYKKACEANRPFDAVITDLTVRGGMGGQECVQYLLELDPAAKVIVSSGYSDSPVMAQYRSYGFRDIITKPYQMEDLSEVLHRVIKAQAP
jgi:CheY-like chemotaxis protein